MAGRGAAAAHLAMAAPAGAPTIMVEPTYEVPYYAYRGACTTAYQPIYDAYGEYVGQQVVSVC
jgi:hypothetical protein